MVRVKPTPCATDDSPATAPWRSLGTPATCHKAVIERRDLLVDGLIEREIFMSAEAVAVIFL